MLVIGYGKGDCVNLTLTRQENNKHLIELDYWLGTIDEIEQMFSQDEPRDRYSLWSGESQGARLAMCAMIRAYIKRWEEK